MNSVAVDSVEVELEADETKSFTDYMIIIYYEDIVTDLAFYFKVALPTG